MAGEPEYEPRVRGPQSGAVTAVAVCNFVLGGLYAVCGVILMAAMGVVAKMFGGAIEEAAAKSGDPQVAKAAEGGGIFAMIAGFGVAVGLCVLVVFALPLILAGVGVVKRRQWGRILTLVMGAILGLLGLISLFFSLKGGVGAGIVGDLILVGYGVLAYVVLLNAKNAAEFS